MKALAFAFIAIGSASFTLAIIGAMIGSLLAAAVGFAGWVGIILAAGSAIDAGKM